MWTTTPLAVVGRGGRVGESVRNAVREVVGRSIKFKVELADGDIDDGMTPGEPLTPTFPTVRYDTNPVPRPRIPSSR